jgi:hypothetical protein
MRPFLYAFPCSAIALLSLLLWRFAKNRTWCFYPYLSAFVLYRFLADLALFPIARYKSDWFGSAYWRLETVTLALQFLVNWEFFRGLFRGPSIIQDLTRRILVIVELGVFPAMFVLSWTQTSSLQGLGLPLSPVVEQYLCLCQASLVLVPAAVTWYYRIPLGRNLRGLGLGFGVFLLVRAANFAGLQAFRGFGPYWRMLTPLTFISMIAIWLWAFWEYAPAPERANLDEAQCFSSEMEWRFLWDKAMLKSRRSVD